MRGTKFDYKYSSVVSICPYDRRAGTIIIALFKTKDEEILNHIQLTTIRDQNRSDFANQFINDFRKVYKQDPAFFRLFYYLLGAIVKCSYNKV